MFYFVLSCFGLFFAILLCETNPLESSYKLQMYLASSRKLVLCCAIVYCIILFSHIRFYGFLLWQFLLPTKYIWLSWTLGRQHELCCAVLFYSVLCYIFLRFNILRHFFMSPTQYSISEDCFIDDIKVICCVLYCVVL